MAQVLPAHRFKSAGVALIQSEAVSKTVKTVRNDAYLKPQQHNASGVPGSLTNTRTG
jgi:hypothetical protein